MILGISLHFRMTTQTGVSIFDLDLYFTVHQLCKFAWRNIAFGRILVLFLHENIYMYMYCGPHLKKLSNLPIRYIFVEKTEKYIPDTFFYLRSYERFVCFYDNKGKIVSLPQVFLF